MSDTSLNERQTSRQPNVSEGIAYMYIVHSTRRVHLLLNTSCYQSRLTTTCSML